MRGGLYHLRAERREEFHCARNIFYLRYIADGNRVFKKKRRGKRLERGVLRATHGNSAGKQALPGKTVYDKLLFVFLHYSYHEKYNKNGLLASSPQAVEWGL